MRAVSSHAAFELGALFRQTGDDQIGVADSLVELNGLLQFVACQRVQSRVRAAAFQVQVVEHGANVGRAVAVVARELHARVADTRHFFEDAR